MRSVAVDVGQRLRQIRHARGISLATAADCARATVTRVWDWEQGTDHITVDELHDLALAYGVPTSWLLTGRMPEPEAELV